MRIMIIDDFETDRKAIREIIGSWKDEQIEICGECRDGKEALREALRLHPDICLCDIEMPGMNGFQFAKALRMEHEKCKIIFCSMYSEFQYAKEAMYLDCYGYVLKPVDSAELRSCVEWASGSISMQSRMEKELESLKQTLEDNRPVLRDNFLRELLYGINKNKENILEKAEFFGCPFRNKALGIAVIEVDDYARMTETFSVEKRQMFSLRVRNQLEKQAAGYHFFLVQTDDSHFAFLCTEDAGRKEELQKEMKLLCGRFVSFFAHTDISISCAVGAVTEQPEKAAELLEQCRYILKYKFILGKSRVLTQEEVPESREPIVTNYNEIGQNVKYLLNAASQEGIRDFVTGLLQPVLSEKDREYQKNLCYFVITCIQMEVNLQNCTIAEIFGENQLLWEKLSRFETIQDIILWMQNIMWFTAQYLQKKAGTKESALVSRVKEYIDSHLQEPLTVDMVAEQMYYSGNYLNYVFKKATGNTISEYITSQRVEKAKEMLADPKLKLYEIAEALCYSHTAYFSSVFRKYTGMNPKDWRERISKTANEGEAQ